MTLDDMLLEKLAEWRPGDGRKQLTVPHQATGWTVLLTADRCDALGCLLWEVALRRPTAEPVSTEDVRTWAERVACRVTGLLEPLRVVEVDSTRLQALLRSEAPTARGDKLFYYEALLTGTS